ncbi:hypothetical protein A2U01_0072902, partial [Trifolium medium]|nr:hypothetical protein [Trifolium medium]
DASGSGKDKTEVIMKEKEKRKRVDSTGTQKIRPLRKMVLQEEDDDDTDEEPLTSKRKISEPKAKEVNVEADA